MKLNAREDIEAPIAAVWAILTDYDIFERAAMRRGAEVARADVAGTPVWRVVFTFRGRRREVDLRVDRAEPNRLLALSGGGKALEGEAQLELMELGPRRTRLSLSTTVRPKTLAARLFLQTLKLARARVVRRYRSRAAQLATMIEARSRGGPAGF